MDTVFHYYAALHPARKVPAYITQTRAIVTRMGTVAKFQSPLLTQALTDINALDTSEQATHKGAPAQTADRNAKLATVKSDMRQLKALVQSAADADLLNAQAIITSSGMSVAVRAVRIKPDFAVKLGSVTTTANLNARAQKGRVSYQWQMSLDQKIWSDLPATVKASTSVAGLTPATVYYFRYRSLTVAGLSDWSATVVLIAH